MDPAPSGLIEVVRDDVRYLATRWPSGDVGDDEIRRSSTVLRRLFTYRDLIKVWLTVVGKRDYIVPSSYIRVRDVKRLHEVDFSTSSTAQNVGMKIFSVTVYNKIQDGPSPFSIESEDAPIKRYLNQPACIIAGKPITRDEIVQFVASKLGGAHYDEGRQKPREHSVSAMNQYMIGNRPALINEMLSCGQVLAASAATKELLGALDR